MMNANFMEKLLDGVEVEWKLLGEIADLNRGRVMSKEYLIENKGIYPVFSSQTANNGMIGSISTFDFDGEYVNWTTDGANAGTVFYRTGKFSITNVSGLIKLKDSTMLSYKFLFHWLSIEAKKHVYSGMGNPKLMSHQVEKIPVPIPSLEIQAEIVRILDTFTELTAELTAELNAELTARRNQYEYYLKDLLTIDADVQKAPLGDTCYMKAGKSISSNEISIQKNEITSFACFGGNGIRGYVKKYSHQGEFPIIGRQGALCGNVNYARGDFYATEHAVVVKSLGKYNQRFLFYLLTAMNLNQYKSQGAQPGLAVGNIENIMAPIPPLAEQERIVSILDKFGALTNSITEELPREIELRQKQYEYYRNMLLSFPKQEV